jgi:hypothetical protein
MLLPGASAQAQAQNLRQGGGHAAGVDNSFRLLLREGKGSDRFKCSLLRFLDLLLRADYSLFLVQRTGIIDAIPTSICESLRKPAAAPQGKNVILVVGDGMGWGKSFSALESIALRFIIC